METVQHKENQLATFSEFKSFPLGHRDTDVTHSLESTFVCLGALPSVLVFFSHSVLDNWPRPVLVKSFLESSQRRIRSCECRLGVCFGEFVKALLSHPKMIACSRPTRKKERS